MAELEKVKKIIEAHDSKPKKCPYCFRGLRPKLLKFNSIVSYYCSVCEQFIDLEWDYLHAIAILLKKYSVLKDDFSGIDLRKSLEP
ncbi:MAG: hypothetical protein EU532_10225 [Promethearchaeota archaeon]|nr:MAG: hypothetical protein EU532_10225 [Candidatus Lokiarchaeota archaeon]